MTAFTFDGTWDGLLTTVFTVYSMRLQQQALVPGTVELHRADGELPLFADSIVAVTTDTALSSRVWTGLQRLMSRAAISALATSFLSEDPAMDTPTLRYVVKIFESRQPGKERDFSDPDVLAVMRTCKAVRYDAHRLLQFVRFQRAKDGTYFAMVDPVTNVLPMTLHHFTNRFADQRFILYDRRRGYGYLYDGHAPQLISLPDETSRVASGYLPDDLLDPQERLFRQLWKCYFHSIAIPERANPKKQRQDMPVRYWRFLPEKN